MKERDAAMLFAFLGDISGRRRRQRVLLGVQERLLTLLDQENVLDVDAALAARLSVGRKTLSQAIWGLALGEALHLLANRENAIRIMTNAEYGRFMTERSRAMDIPSRPAVAKTVSRDLILSDSRIPLPMGEMDSELFTGATLGGAPQCPDYDWFAIDIAPSGTENPAGTGAQDNRKILPEREREPWPNAQGVGLD